MENILTRFFWPILTWFENDEYSVNYKKSHRVALNIVGVLFLFLSIVAVVGAYFTGELGAVIPVIIFFSAGLVAVVVGMLGSNSAVSKIWGTK